MDILYRCICIQIYELASAAHDAYTYSYTHIHTIHYTQFEWADADLCVEIFGRLTRRSFSHMLEVSAVFEGKRFNWYWQIDGLNLICWWLVLDWGFEWHFDWFVVSVYSSYLFDEFEYYVRSDVACTYPITIWMKRKRPWVCFYCGQWYKDHLHRQINNKYYNNKCWKLFIFCPSIVAEQTHRSSILEN